MRILLNKNLLEKVKDLDISDRNYFLSIISTVKKTYSLMKSKLIKPVKGHKDLYRIKKGNVRSLFVVEGEFAYFKIVEYTSEIYKGLESILE